MDFDYFDETELDLRLEQVSDDSYLKTYKLKSPIINYLYLNLAAAHLMNAYSKDNWDDVYENLSKKESDRYEYILPSYNLVKQFEEE